METADKSSNWASRKLEDVLTQLEVDPETGLTSEAAQARLEKYGENALEEEEEETFLDALKEEAKEPMILLLLFVGILYSILGTILDAVTIFAIIAIMVLSEVYNEWRAEQGVESLKELVSPVVMVLRDGRLSEVPSTGVVPGDIMELNVGERISADARLIKAFGLQLDEASLTGESLPVLKDAEAVMPEGAQTADLTNMVLTGTLITQGEGLCVVTSTGKNTELGRVSELAKEAEETETPLQVAIEDLSKSLIMMAVFFSVLIPILGFLRGQPLQTMILTGLALSFAVIPEELPIVITMVLAVGTYALSKQNVIVKRLRASETLGSVTVIATDKTGTLTENAMKIAHIYSNDRLSGLSGSPIEKEFLKQGVLALHAQITVASEKGSVLNPMGVAVLSQAKDMGVDVGEFGSYSLVDEFSFDNKTKLASYVYEVGGKNVVYSSGAPEAIMEKSSRILVDGKAPIFNASERSKVEDAIATAALNGERTLALAYRSLDVDEQREDFVKDLTFLGVISFLDPPREGVKDVVETCKKAGIRVIMLTGDHPETARAIANQIGMSSQDGLLTGMQISALDDERLKDALKTVNILARITPEHKLRVIRLLKELGEVVAVTGDGVNDAPALKESAIGISMGLKGTDAAKEAADMVLVDDNFVSIGNAVKEGRKIFDNLKKGIRYYLAVKVALVLIFLLPIILDVPLPFAPIQIILLEMFMDIAASSGFVAEGTEPDIMSRPPRDPTEKILNKKTLSGIFAGAGCLFIAVSFVYLYTYYEFSPPNLVYAQTAAFAAWILTHIFLAFNTRSEKLPLIKRGLFSNRIMNLWGLVAIGMLITVTNVPFLQPLIKTSSLTVMDWLVVIAASFASTVWIEIGKLIKTQP